MKQIIHFDNRLKEKIIAIENLCMQICQTVNESWQPEFSKRGQHLILEVMRTQKRKKEARLEYFEDDYESFIEVGIEQDEEYFPNGYVPIWKCKEEWFQKTGYLTDKDGHEIAAMLRAMVKEMLEE